MGHGPSLLQRASLLVLLVLPAPAAAGGGDAERFEKLGKNAYARERWDDAVAAFEAAYDADPLPRYLFNIGRSYERKGDLPRAMEYLGRYLAVAPTEEDRRDGKAALVLIEKKLVKVRSQVSVASEPAGARVELRSEGGEVVRGRTPYSGWLTFSRWEVRVSLEGYKPAEQTVDVERGRPVEVSVALEEAAEQPAPPAAEPVVAPEPRPAEEAPSVAVAEPVVQREDAEAPRRGGGWGPWAVAGGGVAALAAGGVVGWLAGSAESERDRLREEVVLLAEAPSQQAAIRSEDESARSRALAANVLYVAGGLAVAAGAAWLVLSGGEAAAGAVRVGVRPGGVVLTWRGGP